MTNARTTYHCKRCGHEWSPRYGGRTPRICPKCKSRRYDTERASRQGWRTDLFGVPDDILNDNGNGAAIHA